MRVLTGPPRSWEATGSLGVAIGVFDGVHLGHRRVLGTLLRATRTQGLASAVLTFDPHPLAVVAPERAPQMLTSVEQRVEQFADLGLDVVAVLPFDQDTRTLPPSGFVADVVAARLGARLVVVGEDFRFGERRTGHVGLLEEMGRELGFETMVVPLVGGDSPISSSRIRQLVAAGRVDEVEPLLGRRFELRGAVIAGESRGADIGFPTANLAIAPRLAVPARGVYAAFAGDGLEKAVVNIGVRPTFGGSAEVVEVHLLDGDRDLYGQELRVQFVAPLRAEQKFAAVEDLTDQIRRDIASARSLFDRTS